MTLQYILDQEMDMRSLLKQRVMTIILTRCDVGPKKHIQRGALYYYIWKQLGFHGNPGRKFSAFCKKLLEENGFPASAIRGHKCIKGLSWHGEDPKNWHGTPIAEDLPIHLDQHNYILRSELLTFGQAENHHEMS